MNKKRTYQTFISFKNDVSDSVLYQLKDYLGSVGLRINHSGTTIDREEYYPFGDSSLRTFSKKRYRYCGKEKDEESGLYYYGARYYAAWTCRFTSTDPLEADYPHFSTYAYAFNNPLAFNDPTGEAAVAVAAVAAKSGAAVAGAKGVAGAKTLGATIKNLSNTVVNGIKGLGEKIGKMVSNIGGKKSSPQGSNLAVRNLPSTKGGGASSGGGAASGGGGGGGGGGVQYNSFGDRVNVFFNKIFNKDFRNSHNERKNSSDTYTYQKTDGSPKLSNATKSLDSVNSEGQSSYNVKYGSVGNIVFKIASLPFLLVGSIAMIGVGLTLGLGIGIANLFGADIGWGFANRVEFPNGVNFFSYGFGNYNKYNMFGMSIENNPFGAAKIDPDPAKGSGFFGLRVGTGKNRPINFIDVLGEIRNKKDNTFHFHINAVSKKGRKLKLSREGIFNFKN